jgi:antitoxin MazE
MQTIIRRQGNSLIIRIPDSLAFNANIRPNDLVDLSLDNEKIVIRQSYEKEYLLNELLENITENNLHDEFDTGKSIGKEIWEYE